MAAPNEVINEAIDLCDEVVDMLNHDARLPLAIIAERRYPALADLQTMAGPQISVSPHAKTSTRISRRASDPVLTVQVIVHQQLQDTEPQTIDPLIQTAEGIRDSFDGWSDSTGRLSVDPNLDPFLWQIYLDNYLVFYSVVYLYFSIPQ